MYMLNNYPKPRFSIQNGAKSQIFDERPPWQCHVKMSIIGSHHRRALLCAGIIRVRPNWGISTKISPLKVGTPFLRCRYRSGIIANDWKLHRASPKTKKHEKPVST